MENNIIPYTSSSLGTIRTTVDPLGRPVLCLKDACAILHIGNVSDARKRLKKEGVVKIQLPTSGKPQNFTFITESNLYRLILQSRKEEAEPFVVWVTEEVLPAIRRTGKYELRSVVSSPETAQALLEDHAALLLKCSLLEKDHKETEEARQFVKRATDSGVLKDLLDVPTILAIEGIDKVKMLSILRSSGILNEDNLPFQEYIDKKYFRVIAFEYGDSKCTIKTNKRVFVYKTGINLILKTIKKEGEII